MTETLKNIEEKVDLVISMLQKPQNRTNKANSETSYQLSIEYIKNTFDTDASVYVMGFFSTLQVSEEAARAVGLECTHGLKRAVALKLKEMGAEQTYIKKGGKFIRGFMIARRVFYV